MQDRSNALRDRARDASKRPDSKTEADNWAALQSILDLKSEHPSLAKAPIDNWNKLQVLFRLNQPGGSIGGNHGGHCSGGNPSDGNSPTIPSDHQTGSGNPTNSGNPTHPGSPTHPGNPTNPGNQTHPGNPTNPGNPVYPGHPTNPTKPNGNCNNSNPTDNQSNPVSPKPDPTIEIRRRIQALLEFLKRHPNALLFGALACLLAALFLTRYWNQWNWGDKPTGNLTQIYIDPVNGNDQNSGAITSPFKSLSHAVKQARSGSTLYLASGQYGAASGETLPVRIPKDVTLLVDNQPLFNFTDIQNHWAAEFIRALAARGVIVGFPDGTFQPNANMTRAEAAALLVKAFNLQAAQSTKAFRDVPPNFWGYDAIQRSQDKKFLVGFPDNEFRPNVSLQRVEVMGALAGGLGMPAKTNHRTLGFYEDWDKIPGWAKNALVAATENRMVVNHPNPKRLNPTQTATRAEVAVMIYQALVAAKQAPPIESVYVIPEFAAR